MISLPVLPQRDLVPDRTPWNHVLHRADHFRTKGPNYCWCLDQNEKLGPWGIKVLLGVDSFSRYPIYWLVS